jgi:hypothetical protein
VFLLGGLVLLAVRMPPAAAIGIVGMFAILTAGETPAADTGAYMLGLRSAVTLLIATAA